ncbi:MAG: DUF1295 domain-containing protein [Actinomycetota bacterium]
MSKARRNAVIGIIVAAVLGSIISTLGGDGGEELGGLPTFAWLVIIAFGVNIAVFVPSFLAKTEHYYDLTGSLTYLTVTLVALITAEDRDLRTVLFAVLIVLWAGRLGSFLFRRVRRDGGDGRFDKIKLDFLRFLMAWMVQGLWVTLTAGAALAAMTSGAKEDLGVIGIIGLIVWIIGFAIEVTADRQKSAFRADPANQGKFIDVGLWAWSRHPNYFGEITLWLGIAILALPVLQGWQYATLISPVFVFVLLNFVSGVPMLERRSDKKWGGQGDYEAYKAKTPVLVLRPPR